jgi:hypothetical protein
MPPMAKGRNKLGQPALTGENGLTLFLNTPAEDLYVPAAKGSASCKRSLIS